MTAPRVLALDLSLTSTGVALPDGTHTTLRANTTGPARLDILETAIHQLWVRQYADLVVLEQYAFHGRSAHSHELGELGGVIRLALHRAGMPWVAVVPSNLKKYATGRGNAGKEEMLAAAIRRLDYSGHSNDEADALWLRAMALDGLCHPVVELPAEHRKALNRVAWPTLEAPAA